MSQRDLKILLLNVLEASKTLNISRAHLYVLMGRGEIKSCKVGDRRMIRVADLEEYVANLPLCA